jgi:hypothetical protein
LNRWLAECVYAFRSGWFRLVAIAGGLLLAGCGIGEYEKRMGEFEKQIKYIDEENTYLGDSLRLPEKPPPTEKKTDRPPPPDKAVAADLFFFRPPKGIASNPEDKPVGVFLRYPGKKESGFKALLLAVRATSDRAAFQKEVLEKLHGGKTERRTIERGNGSTLDYDYSLGETDGEPLRIFILDSAEPYRVAIGFQHAVDSARTSRSEDAIRLSLGSLRLGEDAAIQHQAFLPQRVPAATGRAAPGRGRN